MAAALLPEIRWRAIDEDGEPIAGALLYSWIAGMSTPLATYSDSDLTIANTNPVVADGGGLFGPIYLSPQGYKFGLYPANLAPPVVPTDTPYWTQDNVVDVGAVFAGNFGSAMTDGAALNVTSGYVITDTNLFVTVASSGATILNFPAASTRTQPVAVKNVGAGTVVCTANGTDVFEVGLSTITIEAAATPLFPCFWFYPISGGWMVLASHRAA